MELITQFINDLGNFIFIPVIFLVLMKILGRPLSECISSAIKVGIGFIALTMTIKLMLEKMQKGEDGLDNMALYQSMLQGGMNSATQFQNLFFSLLAGKDKK